MSRHDGDLRLGDWFCGAGGSTQGAAAVPGVRPIHAANHWARAIESHAVNFPDVDHWREAKAREDDPQPAPIPPVAERFIWRDQTSCEPVWLPLRRHGRTLWRWCLLDAHGGIDTDSPWQPAPPPQYPPDMHSSPRWWLLDPAALTEETR